MHTRLLRAQRIFAATLLTLLAACGGDDAPGSQPTDVATPADAVTDAAVVDAGSDAWPQDAGPEDVGEPDTGEPDTGEPDTSEPDTGKPDTGEPHDGVADVGAPDAGEPDAGVADAGELDTVTDDALDATVGGDAGTDAAAPDAGDATQPKSCTGLCGQQGKPGTCSCAWDCEKDNSCCTDFAPSCSCAKDAECATWAAPCEEASCDPQTKLCGFAVKNCNDNNACTLDTCDAKGDCGNPAVKAGTPCDDGDLCTTGDACAGSSCTGKGKGCDDNNACTDDSCDSLKGTCKHAAATAGKACDDGDKCTESDACVGDKCAGKPKSCDDNNPCTEDSCDPKTSACASKATAKATPCDDGDLCTSGDACASGKCEAGQAKVCDDGDPCTADACAPKSGTCGTSAGKDGVACQDGDACTAGDTCKAGACAPGKAKVCDDGNPCTLDVCDTKTGTCGATAVADGSSCIDGNACTTQDACQAGTCVGGAAPKCPGDGACTVAVCDKTTGCAVHPKPDGADCGKGEVCNVGACTPLGACPKGQPACAWYAVNPSGLKALSDAFVVTYDTPNTKSQPVTPFALRSKSDPTNTPLRCSLANHSKCLWSENGGAYAHTTILVPKHGMPMPEAGVELVVQLRNSSNGPKQAAMAMVEWGQGFEKLTENSKTASYVGIRRPKEGVKITYQALSGFVVDPVQKGLTNVATELDGVILRLQHKADGNFRMRWWPASKAEPTTWNKQGKAALPKGRDWRVLVNTGGGSGNTGAAQVGSIVVRKLATFYDAPAATFFPPKVPFGDLGCGKPCDDGDPCTKDSCDPATGACVAAPANAGATCDDGDACTAQTTCQQGKCVAAKTTTCDDGEACTTDVCDPDTGKCVYAAVANGTGCSDGDACTAKDACQKGTCASGTPKTCPKAPACQLAVCDAKSGQCGTAPMLDGTACGAGKACTSGQCVALGTCPSSVPACTVYATNPGSLSKLSDRFKITYKDFSGKGYAPIKLYPYAAKDPGNKNCGLVQHGKCAMTTHPENSALAVQLAPLHGQKLPAGGVEVVLQIRDAGPDTSAMVWFEWGAGFEAWSENAAGANHLGVMRPKGVLSVSYQTGKDTPVREPMKGNPPLPKELAGLILRLQHTASGDWRLRRWAADKPEPTTWHLKGKGTLPTGGQWRLMVMTAKKGRVQLGSLVIRKLNALHEAPAKTFFPPPGILGDLDCKTAVCDDKNDCTTDTCSPQTGGCVFTPVSDGKTCDDGDACHLGEACAKGQCSGGKAKVCADGNACTADGCDSETGACQFPAAQAGTACTDGDQCTPKDTCDGTTCKAGAKVVCDDGDACTVDSCDSKSGKCGVTPVADAKPCTDNNACTVGDACKSGACVAGKTTVCDDGNPCTKDACDTTSGKCTFVPLTDGSGCSDGKKCTVGDACKAGACVAGPPKACVAGSFCMQSACDPGTGQCKTGPKADGVSCGSGEVCNLGQCTKLGACPKGQPACAWYAMNPSLLSKLSDAFEVVYDTPSTKEQPITPFALRSKSDPTNTVLRCSLANHAKCLWSENGGQVAHTTVLRPKNGQPMPAGGVEVVVQLRNSSNGPKQAALAMVEWGKGFEKLTENSPTASYLGIRRPKEGIKITYQALSGFVVDPVQSGLTNVVTELDGVILRLQHKADGSFRMKWWPASKAEPAKWNKADKASLPTGKSWRLLVNTGGGSGNTGAAQVGSVVVRKLDTFYDTPAATFFPPQAPFGDLACTKDCDDGDPCTIDSCNPVTGACVAVPAKAGAACDDGDACTSVTTCQSGKCVAAKTKVCSDGKPCTKDTCDKGSGACVFTPLAKGTACSDGDACTVTDTCDAGVCKPGAPKACAAGTCQVAACDSKTGTCGVSPAADGAECGTGKVCTSGQCAKIGTCPAGVPACTVWATSTTALKQITDRYIIQQKAWVGAPTPPALEPYASSGSGSDKCSLASHGQCIYFIQPNNGGHVTLLTPKNGHELPKGGIEVVYAVRGVDDKGIFGLQFGAAFAKWTENHDAASFFGLRTPAQGSTWTYNTLKTSPLDVKIAGSDRPASAKAGLILRLQHAADGSWRAKRWVAGTEEPKAWDKTGKGPLPTAGVWRLYVANSKGSRIQFGGLVLRTLSQLHDTPAKTFFPPANHIGDVDCKLVTCGDGNPCTKDACDPNTGACVYTDATGACDDGDPCTTGDACAKGACAQGQTKSCADGNACTTDVCDGKTGACSNPAAQDGAPCSDGDGCSLGDTCKASACKAGPPKTCDDSKACTADSCDPKTGACVFKAVADGATCSDGDPCSLGDGCKAGACAAGKPKACSDGATCTQDACDKQTGSCTFLPVKDGTACDDGAACTQGDACKAGSCAATPVTCDDNNPCTADSCDPATGKCKSVAKPANTSCGTDKVCVGTVCQTDPFPCSKALDACTVYATNPDLMTGLSDRFKVEDFAHPGAGKPATPAALRAKSDPKNTVLHCSLQGQGKCMWSENPVSNAHITALSAKHGQTIPATDVEVIVHLRNASQGSKKAALAVFEWGKGLAATNETSGTSAHVGITNQMAGTALRRHVSVRTLDQQVIKEKFNLASDMPTELAGILIRLQQLADGSTRVKRWRADQAEPDVWHFVGKSKVVSGGAWRLFVTTGGGPGETGAAQVGSVVVRRLNKLYDTKISAFFPPKSHVGDVACPGGCNDNDPCTVDACNTATQPGKCEHKASADGVPCDDGDACTAKDACAGGKCASGAKVTCADGEPCTTDSCDKAFGCLFAAAADGTSCSGSACVSAGACKTGKCEGAKDKAFGVACEDGNVCTSGTLCREGACVGGAMKSCDDGKACTVDACDGKTGACSHKPAAAGWVCAEGGRCDKAGTCTPATVGFARQVDAEETTSCALTTKGTVWCWGHPQHIVQSAPHAKPEPIPASAGAVRVAVGFDHSCLLDKAGSAHCWGSNAYGEINHTSTTKHFKSATTLRDAGGKVYTGVQAVQPGRHSTCLITGQGEVHCWGYNAYGACGTGGTKPVSKPTKVAGIPAVSSLEMGYYGTCAMTAAGAVWCWGRVDKKNLLQPTKLYDAGAAGALFETHGGVSSATCYRTASGDTRCAGYNLWSSVNEGLPGTKIGTTATLLIGPRNALRLAHSQALGADRSLHVLTAGGTTWTGGGWALQRGLGEAAGQPVDATLKPRKASFLSVAAGYQHVVAVTLDGKVWSWGEGSGHCVQQGKDAVCDLKTSTPTLVFGTDKAP